MMIDQVRVREVDDDVVERSARVRWDGGELRVRFQAPAELATAGADASPFVPAALLPAMCRREDLEVDGPVSPTMLRGAMQARDLYVSWAPDLHPSSISVADDREPERRSEAIGCFFSRGVDSTYSAAAPRSYPGPLARLVFVDGLEPKHDDAVRAEEIRLAGESAAAIGLPLSVCTTNLRELTDPVVMDWEDMAGGGLTFAATSLGGGAGQMVIPSTDGPSTLSPSGVSPLLDPLFSSGAVHVYHDSVAHGRVSKGLWIARERPDLLRWLKVCSVENRADNCGRCSKCLLTMVTLAAADSLEPAEQFPDEIDLDLVRAVRMNSLQPRADWTDGLRALDPERHGALRQAILEALSHPPRPRPNLPDSSPSFRHRASLATAALLRSAGAVGLVRALDRSRRRHLYGAGSVPDGELVGELGALTPEAGAGGVPLHMTPEGYLVTPDHVPDAARPGVGAAVRWAAAPLAWRDAPGGLRARAGGTLRRAAALAGGPPAGPSGPTGPPLGYLHRDPGPGRLPLHSAIHPVSGDQLLTTDRWEAVDLGYGEPALLGHLEASAPVTGRLGTSRPHLPLASRFGQRVRGD